MLNYQAFLSQQLSDDPSFRQFWEARAKSEPYVAMKSLLPIRRRLEESGQEPEVLEAMYTVEAYLQKELDRVVDDLICKDQNPGEG